MVDAWLLSHQLPQKLLCWQACLVVSKHRFVELKRSQKEAEPFWNFLSHIGTMTEGFVLKVIKRGFYLRSKVVCSSRSLSKKF